MPAITEKTVADLCGVVALRKGKAYVQAGKVTLSDQGGGRYEGVVAGAERFLVHIDLKDSEVSHAACSCPTLGPSFKYKCQHVAAILLALSDQHGLSAGLFNLFNQPAVRPPGHQRHFEDRREVPVRFLLGTNQFGGPPHLDIRMQVDNEEVRDIRAFLKSLSDGEANAHFNPAEECFSGGVDAVLRQLAAVKDDRSLAGYGLDSRLTIPVHTWHSLLPLLHDLSDAKLNDHPLVFKSETLPVTYRFTQTAENGHLLHVDGIETLTILPPYRTAVRGGDVFLLETEDIKRLADLAAMLKTANARHIAIPDAEVGFFLEKVVPGLRKIGTVEVDGSVTKRFAQSPLEAKLYLDRLNNRLLASLEFVYGQLTINPLVNRELPRHSVVWRDREKEEAILALMEEAQFATTDEGYFLHNEELEYEFLYHLLPKLQQLVRVYATTAIRIRIFKGSTKPRIRVKHFEERTNWLDFKFEMDGIPGKEIKQILAALEEKRKYYRLRDGTLFSLESKELERLRQLMDELPESLEDLEKGLSLPFAQGIRLLNSGNDEPFTLEESASRFLEQLKSPSRVDFPVPGELDGILREYQKDGFRWMKLLASLGVGGILADDMGLGKTAQSITYILSELPRIREKKQPVLIVCPSSLTYNWKQEFAKFAPSIRAHVADGERKKRIDAWKRSEETDVLITSYPLLRRDIEQAGKVLFHTVFFDEAQAFKNPFTQTARTVKRIQADHRFALTGTPIENSLEEVWSLFHVILPELFGGLREFSELDRKTVAKRIRPFLLRRMKEDVASELPEKMETIDTSELLPEQKKFYAAYLAKLRHDTLKHLDKDTIRKNKIRILAGLTRLRQICCHPALFVDGYQGTSSKFEQLKELLLEAQQSGRRVLIFSQFTRMLGLIGQELAAQGIPYFYLDGETPSEERLELCGRFNRGERDLFLISLKAGGTGLNLTGADTVILYDLWWNPAVEEQAADRAHRIGQENTVQVIKLLARGTIEEKMYELQERKRALIDEVVGDKQMALSTLTEEDILELLV